MKQIPNAYRLPSGNGYYELEVGFELRSRSLLAGFLDQPFYGWAVGEN